MGDDKARVLFVCTGNTFRSVIAEYYLKNYLKKKGINNISVSSAGIIAESQKINPFVLQVLKAKGIDASKHKQKKLTYEMIKNSDVIIALHKEHQDFIEKNFGLYVQLFNEIALEKSLSVSDIDSINNGPNKEELIKRHVKETINHIYQNTSKIFNYIEYSNFLFLDFINRKKQQRMGYPFNPFYESKYSIAFMSIDIPNKENAHVLVVPKNRFKSFEDIPHEILHDLVETISVVGKAIKKSHEGYNVLLNNGWSAGQRIFHTHFHVIPRNEKDDIKIEIWKNKKLNKNEFIRLNDQIRGNIKEVLKNA